MKNIPVRTYMFALLSCLAMHASIKPVRQSNFTQDIKVGALPVPVLGGGYSDDMQSPLGLSCLADGQIEFSGGTKAVIQLGEAYDFDDIQKTLNVDVSSDVSIDLFSASAAVNYAYYTKETSYSESFYFLEQIILPTKIFVPAGFGESALSPFGQLAYAAGPDQFRFSCGNKFIQQEPLGLNFFATFKINFNTSYDKSNFDASAGGSIGSFFDAKSNIQKIVQENNIRGSLEISAYQDAGDPTQLAQIFGKCDNNYCVTSCSLENLSACQGTIDGIIDYAQNKLPIQVDFKNGQVLGNANPLDYTYMNYAALDLKTGSTVISPEIVAARAYLGNLFQTSMRNSDLVDHILKSQVSANILSDYKAKLQKLGSVLGSNLAVLENSDFGSLGCYLEPTECVNIRKNIDSLLFPIDTSVLDMFAAGYIDRGSQGPYLVFPIGGDQYQSYNNGGSRFTSQETLLLSIDNQTLHADGMNLENTHFVGDYKKIGDGTYLGFTYYDGGGKEIHQFTAVMNPI